MAKRAKIEWAQLAVHHWLLSNTLTDASSRQGKTEADRKEYRKDARNHKLIAEHLGDIAAAEATRLIKEYQAGAGAPDEEEEEEDPGEPVEALQEEEEEDPNKLPPRRRS